ncbi:MAG: hypothetical protein KC501_26920 [Myxococcales bacterium]|nr:hypothetical protein [Myxococcales bacterium]
MRERLTPAVVLGIVLAGSACRPPPPPPTEEDTSGSATAGNTGPGGTTFSAPDACESSEDCEEGVHCIAPYDAGADPPRGPGSCVEVCLEANDLTHWCFDDQGCCGDLRCREVDGFCEPPPGSDESGTSSGGSSTDSGPGTDSSSGGSSGTSGSGTTEGSGSTGTSTG